MIVRYNSNNKIFYLDLNKIESMVLYKQKVDGDDALKLVITMNSGKNIEILETLKYEINNENIVCMSKYPLEKLKKLANLFFKYKNNKFKKIIVKKINKNNEIIEEIEEKEIVDIKGGNND